MVAPADRASSRRDFASAAGALLESLGRHDEDSPSFRQRRSLEQAHRATSAIAGRSRNVYRALRRASRYWTFNSNYHFDEAGIPLA
jgi:hypothetical protein